MHTFFTIYSYRYISHNLHTGERLIQYASENLVTEILIHPQYNTLIQCMRNLLSSFTRHRHIIHAGYTFSGNGSWILQVNILKYQSDNRRDIVWFQSVSCAHTHMARMEIVNSL